MLWPSIGIGLYNYAVALCSHGLMYSLPYLFEAMFSIYSLVHEFLGTQLMPIKLWPYIVKALYTHGPMFSWPYIVTALCSYAMALCSCCRI